MRIRKNAKLSGYCVNGGSSSVFYGVDDSFQTTMTTHVCQLNQSPWDVISFASDYSPFQVSHFLSLSLYFPFFTFRSTVKNFFSIRFLFLIFPIMFLNSPPTIVSIDCISQLGYQLSYYLSFFSSLFTSTSHSSMETKIAS